MLSLLVAAAMAPALAPKTFDWYAWGPYDSSVPRPESILGYGPGDRHTTFRDQEQVVLAIADKARARVRALPYGKSTRGRPLRVFAISSPANIARLDAIQKDLAALADPQPGTNLGAIMARTPAVVWVNQCIHGDETASFESAMWLLYNLAASRSATVTGMLEKTLVLLNPVYNPDGHERYVVFYDSIANGQTSRAAWEYSNFGPLPMGRQNHYRFDMNRDRVALSQAESRQEVSLFLKWNPHVYVDQHGQTENYFFPPNPMSLNANVDRKRVEKWTDVFGRAIGGQFDGRGWTYYIRDVFDLYYPGYLDSWTSLSGAIGMTHETDGGRWYKTERADGSILTMREGAEKHLVSALSVIEAAAKNRAELLQSYAAFKQKAVSGEHAGKFQRVVVASPDLRPLLRFQEQLSRHGIRAVIATRSWKQDDATDYWTGQTGPQEFPAGSLVIDMNQSQGPLAKALLEPQSDFEAAFREAQLNKPKTAPEGETYPGPEDSEFYDTTGWALPYAYNLKAWHCASRPVVQTGVVRPAARLSAPSTVGYAIRYTDDSDILAAYDALEAGVRGMALRKEISVGGVKFAPGTFLFLAARNDEGYLDKLAAAAAKRGAELVPIPTSYPDERWGPGSENVMLLRRPKIGIVFGNGPQISGVSELWFLFDKVWRLPYVPLASTALNGDLSEYTAIILPSGSGAAPTGRFREWVQGGGCAVVAESPGWAIGRDRFVELESGGEMRSLPGALFRARLDRRSYLSYGYASPEIAVPFAGDTVYKVRREGGGAVTFGTDERPLLLTGWVYPDSEKALRGTLWLQDQPLGNGRTILFTQTPVERTMYPGLFRLLLNAMLFGPGA